MPETGVQTFSGERLFDRRQARKLSRETLSRRVGVCAAAVMEWERGICQPNAKYIGALAAALGVEIEFFWARSGHATSRPEEESHAGQREGGAGASS